MRGFLGPEPLHHQGRLVFATTLGQCLNRQGLSVDAPAPRDVAGSGRSGYPSAPGANRRPAAVHAIQASDA